MQSDANRILLFNKYLTVVICFSNFCNESKIVRYFQKLVGKFCRTIKKNEIIINQPSHTNDLRVSTALPYGPRSIDLEEPEGESKWSFVSRTRLVYVTFTTTSPYRKRVRSEHFRRPLPTKQYFYNLNQTASRGRPD